MSDYDFGSLESVPIDFPEIKLSDFEYTINRLKEIEDKIDKIESSITKTAEFIEKIQSEISPIVDKIMNGPLKAFFPKETK